MKRSRFHGCIRTADVTAIRDVLSTWLRQDLQIRAGVGGEEVAHTDARTSLLCCRAGAAPLYLLQGDSAGDGDATRAALERLRALLAGRGVACTLECGAVSEDAEGLDVDAAEGPRGPERYGHLRGFLEQAFPVGWTPRVEAVASRIERWIGAASPEALCAVAREIDRVLAQTPEREACDRLMREELASRYLPRERDGGARPWLQQVLRALLRREGRSVL